MVKDDKIPDINKIDELVEAIRDLEVLGGYSRSYGIGGDGDGFPSQEPTAMAACLYATSTTSLRVGWVCTSWASWRTLWRRATALAISWIKSAACKP